MALKIDIETRGIYAVVIGTAAFVLVAMLRDVVLLLFLAFILAAAFNPWVSWMTKYRIPRSVSIVLIGLLVLAVGTVIGVSFVPLVAEQFSQLFTALKDFFTQQLKIDGWSSSLIIRGLPSASSWIGQAGTFLFRGAIDGFWAVTGVVIMVYYLSADKEALPNFTDYVTPKRWRPRVRNLLAQVEIRLGHWLRGQLILGLVVGTLVAVGLSLMHVKYAIALGLIAAVTELIPSFGPYIGMVPAALIAYGQNHWLALWVVILYYGIQQLENNLLAPKILARAVGIHPVVIIVSLLLGARLLGVLGVAIAVPTCIIVDTVIKDWRKLKTAPV